MHTNYDLQNLRSTDFSNRNLRGFSFVDSMLADCNFSNADLTACNFENARLDNANLKGAKVKDAFIKGAVFKGAILPNGQRASSFFQAVYAMTKRGAIVRRFGEVIQEEKKEKKVVGKRYSFYLDWEWIPSDIDIDGNDRRRRCVRMPNSRHFMWITLPRKEWREPCFWYKSAKCATFKQNPGGFYDGVKFKKRYDAFNKEGYLSFQHAQTAQKEINRIYRLGLQVFSI